MDSPLISIIIPVYNCREYLSVCVDSILRQDEPDFEVILVNDGSYDGSDIVCMDYTRRDSRVVYINQQNKGVAAARNIGLRKASGRFITFADSDDWLEPNAFSVCLKTLYETGSDMVKFGYHVERLNGNSNKCSIDNIKIFNGISGLLEYTDRIEYHAFVWNMFLKKEIIANIFFNEEINWLEDQIFGYQCFLACQRIAYIPDTLYHYRYWDNGSLSSVRSPNVIARASQLEHNIKITLTEGDTYRQNIDDEYRWRLEFLVATIYSSKTSCYKSRKDLSESVIPLFPLKLREGRIFFNNSRPFFLNDLILRALFRLKKILTRNSRQTRV